MATTITVDCPICLIPYDENERRPLRTFCRCKQSLCEPCLNQLLQHGNQCPWDRTRWIGRNVIQKFVFSTPSNYLQYLQQKAVLDAQDSRALQAAKSSSPPAVKKGTSDLVAEENVDQQLALLLMLQEETEQSKQRRQMEEDFLFAKQLLAEEVHRRISVHKDANSSSSVTKPTKASKGPQSIGPSSLASSQHDEKVVKLDKFLVPKPVEELWIADDDDDDVVVEVMEPSKHTPTTSSPRKGKSCAPRLSLSQTETTKKEKAAPIMRFLQKIDSSALSQPSASKAGDYADPNPILAGIKRMRSLPTKAPVSSLEKKLIDVTADTATAHSSISSSSSPSPPWSYRSSSSSSSSSSSRHVSSSSRRDTVDFDLTQQADSDGLDTDVQPRKRPAKSVARNRLLDENDSEDSWDCNDRFSYSRDFSSTNPRSNKRRVTLRRTFLDHGHDDDDDDDDDALLWTQSTPKPALYRSLT